MRPNRLARLASSSLRRSFSSSSATVNRRRRLDATSTLRDFLPRETSDNDTDDLLPPYLTSSQLDGNGKQVWIETYGCQMNVADTEVVHAVLKGANYSAASDPSDADVVLLNTCAIRENAEQKIWDRLRAIRAGRRKARQGWRKRGELAPPRGPVVGLLGCMGERLKGKLLEEDQLVDVVCGPDAYRSLPRLLATAHSGQPALDVQLSLDETYADVAPVREGSDGISAFVSIMRGCNNMCSYCIVPHTRGRERSRPASSIAVEVARLASEGYREVTLLGQNVNSYADGGQGSDADVAVEHLVPASLREGFTPMVPPPKYATMRFAGLMEMLASAHPEMRFRFTSPHPKDFPDELLDVIASFPNACASLHIPAQSGSTKVLQNMRRGYSRETYLRLIDRVREVLPNVALSSDFISGFCGETEADHLETLTLLEQVRFDKAFMFAYSLREKTHAHRKLVDDVPEETKQRRLREVIDTFTRGAKAANEEEVGKLHHVLLESISKKSDEEWVGRTDTNKKVVVGRADANVGPGDFVAVKVTQALSHNTLRGEAVARCGVEAFARGEWG